MLNGACELPRVAVDKGEVFVDELPEEDIEEGEVEEMPDVVELVLRTFFRLSFGLALAMKSYG